MDTNRIVVFGATSAIAQAASRIFAEKGVDCCLVARNAEKLSVITDDLDIRGAGRVVSIHADLSDTGGHEALFSNIKTGFGDFDSVLVAYGTLSDQKTCERDFELTLKELNINFLSVVSLLTHVSTIYLENNQQGQIAVISSVAGDRGRQSNYIYGTAKGALTIFLQGLRNRLTRANINVLTIKPGFVDTPMTKDFEKGLLWASPEKVARGIVAAMEKRRDVVYVPMIWRFIMLVIRLIPERFFKKLNL